MAFMAPVFELPLSDVTVMDGQRAVLECRVIGTPRPSVTWYVDGIEIKKSEDFEITYEEGRSLLIIFDTMMEDEGEYTVKAVNEAGTCISTAYLTVQSMCLNICVASVDIHV
jgi:titin